MKWAGVICACAMAAAIWAQAPRPAAGKRNGAQMRDRIKRALTEMDQFEKSGGAEHLEKAVEGLEEVDLLSLKDTADRLAARREMLTGWCRALRAIDRLKDPKFDPDDAPQLNVAPPMERGGAIHTPSVDPKTIQDPQTRQAYQAARAANEKKKADRKVQWLVRDLEERAVERVERLVQRMYTKSAADRKEMEAVVAETKVSAERRGLVLR